MQINSATLYLAWILRQVGKRIKIRGWERLLRTLFHPDKQRRVAFQIPFDGYIYPAYADSIIDWNALFYGTYETFELKLLAAMADAIEGAVFMDAGANVGHHTLYMASHADHVHAFEPNPALWPLIQEKISINNLTNVVLHRCGLGCQTDQLPLYLGPESGEASLLAGASRTSLLTNTMVSIVQGDDYFQQNKIHQLDIIKIDIEGFEKYAIDGMRNSIDTWHPLIMIEISETGRQQFGNFKDFIDTFPKKYEIYFCHLEANIVIRTALCPANKESYSNFIGNVFCVPEERKKLFIKLAGKAAVHTTIEPVSDDLD